MGLEEMILVERERRGVKRGMKQGMEQGMENKKREIIINMIQKKFTDEIIADIANVSLEYIEEIRETLPN